MRKVDVGHYSAHCQEDLAAYLEMAKDLNRLYDQKVIELFIQQLRESPKFAINMPDIIPIIDKSFRATSLQLPYTSIVIETPCIYIPKPGDRSTPCDKTIALASMMPGGEILVNSVSHCYAGNLGWHWVPGPSSALLSLDDGPRLNIVPPDDSTEQWWIDLRVQVGPSLRDAWNQTIVPHIDESEQSSILYQDIADECRAVIALLWALEQRHATVERHDPPDKLNKKRIARGAIPFDEYHVLNIQMHPHADHVDSGMRFPDRMSPREHQRAGHWRHYKSGKRRWINQMTVNEGVGGAIWKDYRVKR